MAGLKRGRDHTRYRSTKLWLYLHSYMDCKKKDEAKIETAEIKFLRSVAGYRWKDQIRYIKVREELLKIFNLMLKL
jgi:hypothetical protein